MREDDRCIFIPMDNTLNELPDSERLAEGFYYWLYSKRTSKWFLSGPYKDKTDAVETGLMTRRLNDELG